VTTSGGSITLTDEPREAGTFAVASLTDVGRVRAENQDAVWSCASAERAVLVVADGMGGHKGGAAASRTAIHLMSERLECDDDVTAADVTALFAEVAEAVGDAAPDGGTTLVATVLSPGRIDVWHVGDSRAYLWREGSLTRVTADHSWVHALVAKGKLTEAEAARHPRRNVLLRAIGKDRDATPDHGALRLVLGDTLLLCSDGLHGVLLDNDIAVLLAAGGSLDDVARRLVAAALERGAPDNVSVALGSWTTFGAEGTTTDHG